MTQTQGLDMQLRHFDEIMLVDELSSTEYYVGWSNNFSDPAAPNWRIRRIWKVGNVWKFEFPDGNQDYIWIWDSRLSYQYWT